MMSNLEGAKDHLSHERYLAPHRQQLLFFICFVAIAFVYLTHLGEIPVHLIADECRRALVAMEMNLSGNYMIPTLNGEPYLNKPPLYSWIISASYHLFGNYSAFALRFPVIVSLLVHGMVIYFILKKYCNESVAAISALAYLTNGRTLMFDSMLGLLEHTLALMMYLGFIAIFIFGEKKKFLLLFTVSYFIAALGFLVKGLPAIVHHGIALVVYFGFFGQKKLVFSRYHIAGILVFFITLAMYYIPFFISSHIAPENIWSTVFHESSKRYYFKDIGNFFHIIVDFPVDFLYHFLPWTLFTILLLNKNILAIARENKFIWYGILLFLTNSPIYWFAALKNPHYLYFLLPLLFPFLFYLYFRPGAPSMFKRGIHIVLGVGIGMMVVTSLYVPFIDKLSDITFLWGKSIFLCLSFSFLFIMFLKSNNTRLYLFIGAVILVRLAFNWFVIPSRIKDGLKETETSRQIFEQVKQAQLYIMAEFPAGYYDGITYYEERYRNEILRLTSELNYDSYYLVDDIYLNKYPHQIYLQFPYTFADNNLRFDKKMYLVKFLNTK
ncbi:MAG: glycosyltransferase family 39 protein [Saprospiraceae bacterium]